MILYNEFTEKDIKLFGIWFVQPFFYFWPGKAMKLPSSGATADIAFILLINKISLKLLNSLSFKTDSPKNICIKNRHTPADAPLIKK